MTSLVSAARAPIGKILLLSFVLSALTACGADDPGSHATAQAAAGPTTGSQSVVASRTGVIDRGHGEAPKVSGSTTVASNGGGNGTAPPPKVTTPPPGTPPVNGLAASATLDWTPPTQNSDGTTLTNLAGYTVYYGTSPDRLTQSVKLTNPGLTAFTVSNLSSGTWYFAVTSYSSAGVESPRSDVISTKI